MAMEGIGKEARRVKNREVVRVAERPWKGLPMRRETT
jgi:hypothetical protein